MATFFISVVTRYGVWIAPPVFLITAAFLILNHRSMLKTIQNALLFSIPLAEQQDVEFSEPGRVALWVEGPNGLTQPFAARTRRLKFELNAPDGTPVKRSPWPSFQEATGLSWQRIERARYDIPAAGRYTLQTQGIEKTGFEGPRYRIVFTRLFMGRVAVLIVTSIPAGFLFLGSIALFALSIAWRMHPPKAY